MVKSPNTFGRLSVDELRDFEAANQIQLPDDYRTFLLRYNGGEPMRQKVSQPSTVVRYILGMHNGDYEASLYKHIALFLDKLPYSTLPIATDPFGNLFIMSVHPESYGQIYFWEHEGEPAVQDGHYTGNTSFVAYSFKEFIKSLK